MGKWERSLKILKEVVFENASKIDLWLPYGFTTDSLLFLSFSILAFLQYEFWYETSFFSFFLYSFPDQYHLCF